MLIVFLCVDPHSVEFRYVLYLKCRRLRKMLDVILVYTVLMSSFWIIKRSFHVFGIV